MIRRCISVSLQPGLFDTIEVSDGIRVCFIQYLDLDNMDLDTLQTSNSEQLIEIGISFVCHYVILCMHYTNRCVTACILV